jgi:methionyl aminopeptidase
VSLPDLAALRQAGRVASAARRLGAAQTDTGRRLADVRSAVEAEIARLGAGLAFPVQVAVNEIAAHSCPAQGDATLFREGDLAKLDIGVHVDGWVVDTAVTVNVGGRAEGQRLVDAAEAALHAALVVTGPRVRIHDVSLTIETTLRSRGLRPVESLCGHGVGRWTVHCPPAIPNYPEGDLRTRFDPGTVVAIEVFATDGDGHVEERGVASIYRLDPLAPVESDDPELLAALRAFRGLPFAAHQLTTFSAERVAAAVAALTSSGLLRSYRPLVDVSAAVIAQAEHTLYVHEDRAEVLTL